MPALPDHPGILKVETFFTVGADMNVRARQYYLYTGTPPSNATCVTIATDANTLAVTNLVPLLANENNLEGVKVTDLTTPASGVGEYLTPTPGSRGSGDPLAAEVAVLHNHGITRRYRGGKPRNYWPFGIGADLTSPSAWASGSIIAFEAGLNAYILGIQAISVAGCVVGAGVSVSNYSGFSTTGPDLEGRFHYPPKVRAAAIAPDLIVLYAVNPKPGSQRRRQQHST